MAEEMKEHGAEDKTVAEGKVWAILAYLGILCLLPLLLKKENKFALFHGKQGLVLFVGEVAIAIINIIPILGQILWFIGVIVFGIFSLMGMVQVLMGKYWKMPIVFDIAEKFKI